MRRLMLLAALLAGVLTPALAARAEEPEITYGAYGRKLGSTPLSGLRAWAPAEHVRVFEPHEEAPVTFAALPLVPVLERMFGKAWTRAESVIFNCADGYRAPVAVADLAANPGWLAFARQGSAELTVSEKSGKRRTIAAGPLYLIRDSGRDLAARRKGDSGWPYQVVGIELATFADLYPRLTLPKGASETALRGYQEFRRYCVSCHALNGDGGKVGPELNAPVSVTVYYKTPWLKRWIARPSSIRAGTAMPEAVPQGPDQGRIIDDLVAYLAAMAERP